MKSDLNRNLRLALAGMLAMLLLVGGMAIWYTTQVQKDAASFNANTRGSAELGQAGSALWQLRYGIAQFMVSDPAGTQKLAADEAKRVRAIDDALAAYAATEIDESEAKSLKSFRQLYKQYTEARPKWFALQLEGKTEEAADWRAKTTTPFGAGTVKGFADLIDAHAKTAANELDHVNWQAATYRYSVIAVTRPEFGAKAKPEVATLSAGAFARKTGTDDEFTSF